METIGLACSVERMTSKDADSAESVYLVCPKIDGLDGDRNDYIQLGCRRVF